MIVERAEYTRKHPLIGMRYFSNIDCFLTFLLCTSASVQAAGNQTFKENFTIHDILNFPKRDPRVKQSRLLCLII